MVFLPSSSFPRRLAALLEIAGVFVTGTLVARAVARQLALGPANLRALAPGEQPDFVTLSASTAANLVLRYGLILALALIIGYWHRRRHLRAYGVTFASSRVREHVRLGLLLFAAAGLPSLLIKTMASRMVLRAGPPHWALIQDLNRPGIWLYLLVGSFGLVPIAEELFFRGYVQTRLAEDFGASAAILMTALFFTLSHTQYFIGSVIGSGMVVSLLIASVAIGYVRHRTGSLLPGIIAHSAGNLPFRGWGEAMMLTLMLMFVILRWRAVSEYARRLWRDVIVGGRRDGLAQALVVIVAMFMVFRFAPTPLLASGAGMLGGALLLESRDKRFNDR